MRENLLFQVEHIYPAAEALLPVRLAGKPSRAQVCAIALQESMYRYRKQIGGPAHGFHQFEEGGGVRGVLEHPASRPIILPILEVLRYTPSPAECYEAITHNDVLGYIFARLLLWTSVLPLAAQGDAEAGWKLYIDAWRPGQPHRGSWDAHYRDAWEIINKEGSL